MNVIDIVTRNSRWMSCKTRSLESAMAKTTSVLVTASLAMTESESMGLDAMNLHPHHFSVMEFVLAVMSPRTMGFVKNFLKGELVKNTV